ncbi:MAG: UDP-N-acetylglucosamine--N-acetylmuramyl-(pentapeptide) pyrophosphoryl-undecaprenol N-acetylglucosamine transferase [Candidatus Saccharimonadales bacterium]
MTIVLCGGGSGGHITPLLPVALELRQHHPDVRLIYVGERGGKFASIATKSKLFDEYHFISAGKLRRYHGESFITKFFDVKTNLLNIRDMFRMFAGLVQSYRLLKRLKPRALLLKGGFVCVPLAVAAQARHIPYITHDSDALPGLSNRIAARWARYHATAMPAQYYDYPPHSIQVVGVPTDNRFKAYSKAEQAILRGKYGIPANAPIILVTGGSNGARRLNEAVIAMLPRLLTDQPTLHVLHQIGAGNNDQSKAFPKELADRVTFFDFTPELFHMSAIADVIITRAGATTIADFSAQGKACIIIPNPYLTGGHQLRNAQVYADAKAAVIVQEPALTDDSDTLYKAAKQLLQNPAKRADLAKNLHSLTPNQSAAAVLAKLLLEIAA